MATIERIIDTNYLDNPFTVDLLKDVSISLFKFQQAKANLSLEKQNYDLSELDKFLSRTFSIHNRLGDTYNQIFQIRTFLKRYPYKDFYQKNDITQVEYIQYHTEVLLHKLHTVLEIMRLLVNEVFQLGLSPKDCTWENMRTLIAQTSAPMRCLTDYFECFREFINLRHLNTHRGIYDDPEKEEIDLKFGFCLYKFEYRNTGYVVPDQLRDLIPLPLINYKIKEHKKSRIEFVDWCITQIDGQFFTFLSSLHSQYKKQVKQKR